MTFGKLLKEMIHTSGLTNAQFYNKLGITKPYFYEIIGDRTNPPPPDKQMLIISILNPGIKTKELFFDLAAERRNEIPADIFMYITQDDGYKTIRRQMYMNNKQN